MRRFLPKPKHEMSLLVLGCALLGWQCGELNLYLDPEEDGGEEADKATYCLGETGTTYYVRQDGGTRTQCNGTENAPYPGEGEGQACAFAHPLYVLPPSGASVLEPGDRLVIGAGEYEIGGDNLDIGDGETCLFENPNGCGMGPVPSGIAPYLPTCVVGEGWDKGCEHPPVLNGTGHVSGLLNLQNSNFVSVGCLELKDEASCVTNHPNTEASCDDFERGASDQVAIDGVFARGSEYVSLKDMYIHGFARFGIFGKDLADWRLDNVQITANGNGGMVVLAEDAQSVNCIGNLEPLLLEVVTACESSDLPNDDCLVLEDAYFRATESAEADVEAVNEILLACVGYPSLVETCFVQQEEYERCLSEAGEYNSSRGKMYLNDVAATMNGCGELNGKIVNCYSGDNSNGLMVHRSNADWYISSSTFAHNTRDGLAIDFVDSGMTVEISNTLLEGNAGTQMIASGSTGVFTSIVGGNCDYFADSPFRELVNSCREGGISMQFGLFPDDKVTLVNNTILGYGDALMSVFSIQGGVPFLDEELSDLFLIRNNIFSGVERDMIRPFFIMPGPNIPGEQWCRNLFFEVDGVQEFGVCDTLSFCDNICEDPLFLSTEGGYGQWMDLSIDPASPAIDSGFAVNTDKNVLGVDFHGNPRPSGEAVDIGAVEYQFD